MRFSPGLTPSPVGASAGCASYNHPSEMKPGEALSGGALTEKRAPTRQTTVNFHCVADLISSTNTEENDKRPTQETSSADASLSAAFGTPSDIYSSSVPMLPTSYPASFTSSMYPSKVFPQLPVSAEGQISPLGFASATKICQSRAILGDLNSRHFVDIHREGLCTSPGSEASSRSDSVSPVINDFDECVSAPTDENEKPAGRKKGRTTYKTHQVARLEQAFLLCQYPEPDQVDTLARELGISETKIKVWFQNKRARIRRRGCPGQSLALRPHASRASPDSQHAMSQSPATEAPPEWKRPTLAFPGFLPSMVPPISQPCFNMNTGTVNSVHAPSDCLDLANKESNTDLKSKRRSTSLEESRLPHHVMMPHNLPQRPPVAAPAHPFSQPHLMTVPATISLPNAAYTMPLNASSTTMHPSPLATLACGSADKPQLS